MADLDLKRFYGLQKRGLVTCRICLNVSKLTSLQRNKLIDALTNGFYPARTSTLVPVYSALVESVNAPGMSVRKGWYAWQIILNDAVPQAVRDAIAKAREADILACKLANNGMEPARCYGLTDGPNCWEISFPDRRKLENVRALARLYADTPEYKAKVAGILEALQEKRDIWI